MNERIDPYNRSVFPFFLHIAGMKFTPILFLVTLMSLLSCTDQKLPVHIPDSFENMDLSATSMAYVQGKDTLFQSSLDALEDTLSMEPFIGETDIRVSWDGKARCFSAIPDKYLNDMGVFSITRNVYQEDLFPEKWQVLKQGVDFVTLSFRTSPEKRFAIVLNSGTGVEIGRYFEDEYAN